MVEKMKKYNFLIYYKTYNEFLEIIRQVGVVHVTEKQKGIPDDASGLRQLLEMDATLKDTMRAFQRKLDKLEEQKDVTLHPIDPKVNGSDIIAEYEQLIVKEEQLKAQRPALQQEIENMSVWGNFDLEILRKFEKTGRQIKFYSCRDREFQANWLKKFCAVEVARRKTFVYFITLTPIGSDEEPEAEKMQISDRSLGEWETALRENESQTEEVQKRLETMPVEHLNNLKEMQRRLHENIDFGKVHLQGEKKADDKLILLECWTPEENEPELIKALETTQDVYYISETPTEKDKTAPILLKNNRYARLFEPIGEMYDLPRYHELDLTPFFAPFFMLFFGVCLGDAGYGLLILIATLYARSKVKASLKPVMSLAAVLGVGTMICGTFTGTFLGIPLLDMEWAWLTSFKKIMFTSDQMFTVALILGVVQIIYAWFVKAYAAIRRYGWAHSLGTVGLLILVLGGGGVYFASENQMLQPDMERYLTYSVLGIAGLFMLVLNTPGRNPLINIGAGLWNTFNLATGLIGDVLSYIRLFALGLCGGVMGFVFNQLAVNMTADGPPVISQLLMIVILLFGHSLNIFISALGAFVHPMRLTFVEFYKNVGFEGGGKKYKPFRYISAEN